MDRCRREGNDNKKEKHRERTVVKVKGKIRRNGRAEGKGRMYYFPIFDFIGRKTGRRIAN